MSFATRSITIAVALTLVASAARAQTPGRFALELRPGAAIPVKDLGPSELNAGVGLEIHATAQVMPHLQLYLGWDWARFTLKENLDVFEDADDTGYAFGARFFAPSIGRVTPWIRAGGVYDHVELEGDDADDYVSADHTLGWEAGAGAAIALNERWSLLPGIRYRAFSPELDEFGGKADMRYLSIDIGFSATFGGPSMASIGHR